MKIESDNVHRQRGTRALTTGLRSTGLRGIGASGLPLVPLVHCETRGCKRKPVVRALDRETRFAFCTVCWPIGERMGERPR